MNGAPWSIRDTDFPAIRRVMGPDRERLDDDALEELLGDLFPGADPEDVESFMGQVQKLATKAAPVAQKALPGMIQGAVQGAAVGGPYGAIAGAAIGGAASAMGGAKAPGAPRPGGAAPAPAGAPAPAAAPRVPAVPAAPATAATPAAPAAVAAVAAGPGGSAQAAAAAQLLSLLARPETMVALLSMLMSGAGRSSVQVGTRQVPAEAFADALAEAAARLGDAVSGRGEPGIGWQESADGGSRRAHRAAVLLSELAAADAARAAAEEEAAEPPTEAEPEDDGELLAGYEAALGRRA